ncbi:MAG: RNB domain-containing ribonuclease, partial [Porticoccaceae bacterium]|nr:RNB domain-containing ribonuclease [Porticoccaceae bacterium]
SQVADRPDAAVIQSVMLRSMRQAVYQDDNKGHFGLNYEAYSHFTSPIRRYADLLVHRAIRGLLRSKKRVAHLNRVEGAALWPLTQSYPYNAEQISEAGSHCSMTERRADDATRSVDSWLKCQYLVDQVGNEFSGVVTSVTGFGLFVQLDELFIEGLVHITGLPRDYYNFEAAHHRLVGERTGRVFRLGDRLNVIVTRVDVDERKIDFDLLDGSANGGSIKKRRGKPAGKASAGAPEKGAKRDNKADKKPAAKRGKKPRKRSGASVSNSQKKPETDGNTQAKPRKKSKKTSKRITAKTAVKGAAKTKKKPRTKSKSNAKRRVGTSDS